MQPLQVATPRNPATWLGVESRFEIACFGVACFIGVAGAFVGLEAHGFWFDELITAWVVEPVGGVGNLATRIATDVHPPLYYAALFAYSQIVGDSDAALRSFSALSMGEALLIFIAATKGTFSLPARLFGGAIASGSLSGSFNHRTPVPMRSAFSSAPESWRFASLSWPSASSETRACRGPWSA